MTKIFNDFESKENNNQPAFFKPIPNTTAAAAAAKLLQSCPTLCDPIDGSPPGFLVPGILQASSSLKLYCLGYILLLGLFLQYLSD